MDIKSKAIFLFWAGFWMVGAIFTAKLVFGQIQVHEINGGECGDGKCWNCAAGFKKNTTKCGQFPTKEQCAVLQGEDNIAIEQECFSEEEGKTTCSEESQNGQLQHSCTMTVWDCGCMQSGNSCDVTECFCDPYVQDIGTATYEDYP